MNKTSSLILLSKKIRSNSVKIKNLRVSKTSRLSVANYNSDMMKAKIRKIKQTMTSYHINNMKKTNELISNTQKVLSKKSIILSLREYFPFPFILLSLNSPSYLFPFLK